MEYRKYNVFVDKHGNFWYGDIFRTHIFFLKISSSVHEIMS